LQVTVVDVSPVGLAAARDAAAASGIVIETIQHDLEADPTLPEGPWDVIFCHNYLNRELFAEMAAKLSPGKGVLMVCHPTMSNLERNSKPSARFLLEDGEAADVATAEGSGLWVACSTEQWSGDSRHEARLVAFSSPLVLQGSALCTITPARSAVGLNAVAKLLAAGTVLTPRAAAVVALGAALLRVS
jgi:hypothetical protein